VADAVRRSLQTIVARALQTNVTGLIAAHNHPSGAAEPREAGQPLTRDLLTAAWPRGLRFLDHVIVAEEATYSFADSGLLDELALEAGVR
jgi:DNA repair protein RadC